MAKGANGDARDGFDGLAKQWSDLADEIEAAATRKSRPEREKMRTVDKTAIAEFLKAGGRISRVKESISVTESELLDYFASRGIAFRPQSTSRYLESEVPRPPNLFRQSRAFGLIQTDAA